MSTLSGADHCVQPDATPCQDCYHCFWDCGMVDIPGCKGKRSRYTLFGQYNNEFNPNKLPCCSFTPLPPKPGWDKICKQRDFSLEPCPK